MERETNFGVIAFGPFEECGIKAEVVCVELSAGEVRVCRGVRTCLRTRFLLVREAWLRAVLCVVAKG